MAFLQSLKTQTSEQHASLEAQLDIVRHFRSKEDYVLLLERFFTLYEPLEEKLALAADWPTAGWDFEGRRKTPWLHHDLLALGLTPAEISALPRCKNLLETDGLAEAVGCLYVLEGSTLGGQVITRLLRQHLDISPGQGGQFFAGYETETVARWREFGSWVERWAEENPSLQAEAVAAARKTFVCFSRWLN